MAMGKRNRMLASFDRVRVAIDPEREYRKCFGDMPAGIAYYDPWRGVDLRPKMAEFYGDQYDSINETFQKGLTVANLTAPVFPLPDLIDMSRKHMPLIELIRRVTHDSKTVNWDQLTALGSAKYFAEGGAPSEGTDTYAPQSQSMSFWSVKGSITGPAVLVHKQRDPVSIEQRNKFNSMKQLEENTIINGDPTVGNHDGGVIDETAYKGLIKLVPAGNQVDMANGTITLPKVREAIDKVAEPGGDARLAVTDYKTLRDLKALLQEQVVYTSPTGDFKTGIRGIELDDVVVVADSYMPTTANGKWFIVIDPAALEMRLLADVTLEGLAKTADKDEFYDKAYGTLIPYAPTMSLAGLKNLA